MSEVAITSELPASESRPAAGEAISWNAKTHSAPAPEALERWPKAGFVLFLLLNAIIFIPTDIFPSLDRFPIYGLLLVADLVLSRRVVSKELTCRALCNRPIAACVVGLFITILLSRLAHFDARSAAAAGISFTKIVFYFLLLIALVNTPARLKTFLWCVAIFASVQTALAVLQYHHVINVPALARLEETDIDSRTGEVETQYRLQGAGIFNDPNDLSMLLVATIVICLYAMSDRESRWWQRALWLLAFGLSGYALMLAKSRGGFMALVAGLMFLLYARFGLKRSLLLAAITLPVLLVVFAGRQTQFHILHSTGQQRIQLWGQGLSLFAHSPVFGIGYGRFSQIAGKVAHNSFLHCFAELGFVGGTCFLGAFFLALWPLFRLQPCDVLDPDLRRLRPFLLAVVVSYAVALLTLSRAYVAPTYMILGASAAYLQLAPSEQSSQRLRLDKRLFFELLGLGVAFLVAMTLFVGVFLRHKK